MSEFWNEVIRRQFIASIEMLRSALKSCPDNLWDDRREGTPVWHIAYHTLFFCDLYLSENEKSFQAPKFHVDKYHFLPGDYKEFGGVVTTPDQSISKENLMDYADHCIKKSNEVFQSLTEEVARRRCGFWWYELNVGEFLLNNLRHLQHHTAQVMLILRRHADIGIEWMGTEHNEPAPPTW